MKSNSEEKIALSAYETAKMLRVYHPFVYTCLPFMLSLGTIVLSCKEGWGFSPLLLFLYIGNIVIVIYILAYTYSTVAWLKKIKLDIKEGMYSINEEDDCFRVDFSSYPYIMRVDK